MRQMTLRSISAAFVTTLIALTGSVNAQTTPYPDIKNGQPGITGYYYQFASGMVSPDRLKEAFTTDNFSDATIETQLAFDSAASMGDGQLHLPCGARWLGQLHVPTDGSYVISLSAKEGVRAWLSEKPIDVVTPDDNAKLIDSWVDNGTKLYDSDPLALSASKSYYLMVELYTNARDATCHLQWTGPGTTDHEDIPTSALTSWSLPTNAHGTVNGTVVDASGKAASGIQIDFKSGDSAYVATSDDKGAYSIDLLPGTYSVSGGVSVASSYSGLPASPIAVTANQTVTVPAITASLPSFYETTGASAYDDDFTGTTLDPKWTIADLDDATGGAAVPNKGELDVTAGGWDVGDTHDGINYVYQTVTGDFSLTMQVINVPENQNWEMGGLDIRTTADKGAAHAFFQTMKSHNFQNKIRPKDGSDTLEYDIAEATTGAALWPIYIKIRRIGDEVAFFWTDDPAKGTVHLGFVERVPGFKNLNQLTAGIASCAHDSSHTIVDDGFAYAHFRIEPIATTTTPSVTLGDINADGKINVQDATLSLRIAVGLTTPTDAQKTADDVNKDGKWNIQDTTLILQVAVGLKSGF